MLSILSIITILCLFLAGGATVVSCLIPQLFILGEIWGLQVIGFALIVSAIFRLGIYFDPRKKQDSQTKKRTGYMAGSLICHLIALSSLELTFQKEQNIAAIIISILSNFATLSVTVIAEYVWVTGQTLEEKYPSICVIRRFFFVNTSSFFVIAYMGKMNDLIMILKPVIIFFSYSNWVFFAAIYSGILRSQTIHSSNESISEC